jgi:hypothetical protein
MEVSGIGDDTSTYKMLANAGQYFAVGIVKTPVLLTTGTKAYLGGSLLNGGYFSQPGSLPPGSGRMSWRQLQ